jgi:hypothetical protein
MYSTDAEFVPDWFVHGMSAVQRAPSEKNNQPVHFYYHKDGTVSVEAKNIEEYPKIGIDLGIARLHFEIGSGRKFSEDSL